MNCRSSSTSYAADEVFWHMAVRRQLVAAPEVAWFADTVTYGGGNAAGVKWCLAPGASAPQSL